MFFIVYYFMVVGNIICHLILLYGFRGEVSGEYFLVGH